MKKNENSKKVDVYQMVTDRVMAQLEQGIIPWQKPWKNIASGCEDDLAISYSSRKPYSFLNQMLLGRNGEWLTFKQIKEMKGSIKKGAKAGMVVFYKRIVVKEKVQDAEGNEKEKQSVIPMLKYFNVYHIDDCTGIDTKIQPKPAEDEDEVTIEPIEAAEKVINGYLSREKSLKLHNDRPSSRAFYSPMFDEVTVPMMKQYDVKDEYYSTLFHELVHSTMTPERMNRAEGMNNHFASQKYSREELVAELGAAMLCAATGINNDGAFKNSVAYIQGWMKELKDDKKAIVWAASRSEKAARFIYNGERVANTI